MKLFVEHQTIFSYDQPVRESVGELRLYPRDDAGQRCLSFRLTTEPQTAINALAEKVLSPGDNPAIFRSTLGLDLSSKSR